MKRFVINCFAIMAIGLLFSCEGLFGDKEAGLEEILLADESVQIIIDDATPSGVYYEGVLIQPIRSTFVINEFSSFPYEERKINHSYLMYEDSSAPSWNRQKVRIFGRDDSLTGRLKKQDIEEIHVVIPEDIREKSGLNGNLTVGLDRGVYLGDAWLMNEDTRFLWEGSVGKDVLKDVAIIHFSPSTNNIVTNEVNANAKIDIVLILSDDSKLIIHYRGETSPYPFAPMD